MESLKHTLALLFGVHGPRTSWAVNTLLLVFLGCFLVLHTLGYESRLVLLQKEGTRALFCPLKKGLRSKMFLGRKLFDIVVFIRFLGY